MANKGNVTVIRKWKEKCVNPLTGARFEVRYVEYEADFWEGPIQAGKTGRYYRRKCIASSRNMPNVSFRADLEKHI